MTHKNFDQLLLANQGIDPVEHGEHFHPHTIIDATMVFEPMHPEGENKTAKRYVRVTARTKDFELLWGTTASEESLRMHPMQVAFYDRLKVEAAAHLGPLTHETSASGLQDAITLIEKLEAKLSDMKKTLSPIKVSDKTKKKAERLLPKLRDAATLIGVGSTGEADE